MLDKNEFLKLMMPLGEIFDKQITESILDIYYDIFKDYSINILKTAFNKVIKTYQFNTLPKPADILEYLEGTPQDKAMIAWLQAKEAVQKGGYYASIEFSDPIISYCITELGGCAPISELPFIEKRFLELYRVLAKRDIKINSRLIGYIELCNSEKGYYDKIPEPIRIGFKINDNLKITTEQGNKSII
jgi:hypothetical protein